MLVQDNACNGGQAQANKHAICGALELVAQPDAVPPLLPAAPHPGQVPSTSPPPPGAQKAGQPLGVYYWAAAGAISPPPRPVASLVPASEPPLSLGLRISAFTGAEPFGGGQLVFKDSLCPSTERVRRTSEILLSTLVFSSTLQTAGGVLRRNVSFRRLPPLRPSSPSPTARSWALSSFLVRFFFVPSLLPVHDIV